MVKLELEMNDAKFVYSKDQLGYKEVLDDFTHAKRIIIITYNISEKKNYLLDLIKKISSKTDIILVTNIPNRWDNYYSKYHKDLAKKKISIYQSKLNPDDIDVKFQIFFNFENHGKIIMTDNIVYIGSANYSDESENNIEFGVISKDKVFISSLNEIIVPDVIKQSEPFFNTDTSKLYIDAQFYSSSIFTFYSDLYHQVYLLNDHAGIDYYTYNDCYDSLSEQSLQNIVFSITDAISNASSLYDIIYDTLTVDHVIGELDDELNKLMDKEQDIEKLLSNSCIIELCNFDINQFALDTLEDKYHHCAYDESLDYYLDKCNDEANDKLYELSHSAKESLLESLDAIKQFHNDYSTFIAHSKKYIRTINPKINNTK